MPDGRHNPGRRIEFFALEEVIPPGFTPGQFPQYLGLPVPNFHIGGRLADGKPGQ
jgi:hypothetical protein